MSGNFIKLLDKQVTSLLSLTDNNNTKDILKNYNNANSYTKKNSLTISLKI